MANANSPANGQGSQLDLRVERYAGAARIARAITTKQAAGNSDKSGDAGIATHYAGERFLEPNVVGGDTPDPIVVVGGALRASTTLGAAVNDTSGTSWTLASAAGLPLSQYVITVDTEDVLVTAGFGTTAVTVVRNWNGTTAATHSNGAAVKASAALAAGIRPDGSLAVYAKSVPSVFKPLSAVVVTSETTIWTPASGKRFRLLGYAITQGVVTGNVTLKDNTGGTTILVIPANTIGVVQVSPELGNGILSAAANNVLTATGASTETLSGYVFGTEE